MKRTQAEQAGAETIHRHPDDQPDKTIRKPATRPSATQQILQQTPQPPQSRPDSQSRQSRTPPLQEPGRG